MEPDRYEKEDIISLRRIATQNRAEWESHLAV
jgi:hypothetical protein